MWPIRPTSPISLRAPFAVVVFAALVFGCGGGGGGGGELEPPPAQPPSGIVGRLMFPDVELGRVVEQEPNDSAAQAFPLTPMWARNTLEVTGHLGATAVEFGSVDPVDVFRFVALADQDVAVSLTWVDVGAVAIGLEVEVFDTETGDPVASTVGGPQPRQTAFTAVADKTYDVVVGLTGGHAAYVVGFATTDPQVSPKPAFQVLEAEPTSGPVAARPPRTEITGYGEDEPPCAPTHVLVRFADESQTERVCEAHDLVPLRRLASGTWCFGYASDDAAHGRRKALSLCAHIEIDPAVEFAEPDWIVKPQSIPSDPEYPRQWNMRAVGAESAWAVTKGSPDIVVGIVDTGIVDHPDLAGRIVPGFDFISQPGVSGDGDGRDADPTDVGDQLLVSGQSTWHGTHVAGVICANHDDGYGCAGLAPGCRVMPLRALGIGGGLVSDVATAILYGAGLVGAGGQPALPEPLPILNLSIGLTIDSSELESACTRAFNTGVFLVGAAGNTGQTTLFPARYPTVFAVAAVDTRLRATGYSNFGEEIEIAAPGGNITKDRWARGWPDTVISSVMDETVFPATASHVGFEGTSEACPHVAATAALLLSVDPTLNSTQLASYLTSTALDVGAGGVDISHGHGLLQSHRALNALLDDLGQPRADPPKLMLPTTSLRYRGFEASMRIPIMNGGGGQLAVFGVPSITDNAVSWLSAGLETDNPLPDVATPWIEVVINRAALPNPGIYSGTVRLTGPGGVLGAIRVVVYVNVFGRAGIVLQSAAIEDGTGIARGVAIARSMHNFRYWMTGLPAAPYLIRAGEDLDEDGFFCEGLTDACGYFGGESEEDATLIFVNPDGPPTTTVDIDVQ